jgi:hypothetical protein
MAACCRRVGATEPMLRLWDARTGVPIGQPIEEPWGFVTSVALGAMDGRAVVVLAMSLLYAAVADVVWVLARPSGKTEESSARAVPIHLTGRSSRPLTPSVRSRPV